jgi:hypothetical protein
MHQPRHLGETIQRFNGGRKAFQEAFESLGKMSLDFQNHLISAARDTVGSLELALKVYLFSYCYIKLTPEDKKKKTQNPTFDDLMQMMKKYADPPLDTPLIEKLYDYRDLRNRAEHDASIPYIEHLQEASNTIREFLLKYLSVPEEKLLTTREIWEESQQVKHVYDPRVFFSGGMPNTSDIAKNVDVRRTQYIQDWIDENDTHQEAWQKILFEQGESTSSRRKVRVVIVYGHRGSGKKTLCKRMIYDLQQASIPVIDRLADPLSEKDAK